MPQSGMVVLVLLLLVLGAAVYFIFPGLYKKEYPESAPAPSVLMYKNSGTETDRVDIQKKYSSNDLNISFNYPSEWFINEKNYFIMITSYPTKIGKNDQPNNSQVEMAVHKPGGCHETIEENLKDPACGEGGSNVKANEILSKETEDINGMKYHKYLIKYPNGEEQKFYFLEKGDRILQIDKNPDPSMFDKEFEAIVKSISFD